MSSSLEGKTAIVTGGGSGIGKAAAIRLARDGARVVICGRTSEPLALTVQQAEQEGLELSSFRADVGVQDDIRELVAFAAGRYGGLDVLVCNAGTAAFGTVESLGEDAWDLGLRSKISSIYYAARHSIPEMRKSGGGTIITISSVHAFATEPNRDLIAATNAAIVGLTRSLAINYGREGIRAVAVCPGPVDTPAWRSNWTRFYPDTPMELIFKAVGAQHPIGRIGNVEEIAAAITFLCGDGAGFLTGSALVIDGGLLARLGLTPPSMQENLER